MGLLSHGARAAQQRESRALMARAKRAAALADEVSRLDDDALVAAGREAVAHSCADEARALALGREAVLRQTGLTLTDEQLACALALADGRVAEASTGSGKTLAAIPAELILVGRFGHVHTMTVNDYLARRDASIAEGVLARLGVTVGCTLSGDDADAKRSAYARDVTYGTATEMGFDYLRDGMATQAGDVVQGELRAAIVDEADSIMVDEARTPLIISGADAHGTPDAQMVHEAVTGLSRARDLDIDEAQRQVTLTPSGEAKVAARLSWPIRSTPRRANLVRQALLAQYLFERDRDYIVRNGKVEIVDEFTGRVAEGRRWSDGLHVAVEAKEGVELTEETRTLAEITLQNYFRLYRHLSGMTGTAMSEDAEFSRVFGMGVARIPDHVPCVREDGCDLLFATTADRDAALVDDVAARHAKGQPVLVGTQTVEQSDHVAGLLRARGIDCTVLNARDNRAEAAVVAEAGRPGRVTVSTNMAGRGTDIRLGGSPEWMCERALNARSMTSATAPEDVYKQELDDARLLSDAERSRVVKAGGLAVVGMGRNDNRRIDDQLRGRSGRQGDPGSSRFYVALDDDLVRLFNKQAAEAAIKSVKTLDGAPLESRAMSGLIEGAQERIAERDAEQRRQTLEYDDVVAAHYARMRAWRQDLVTGALDPIDVIREAVPVAVRARGLDWAGEVSGFPAADEATSVRNVEARIDRKVAEMGESGPSVVRSLLLQACSKVWCDHLEDADALRSSVGLTGIAARDPLVEYKRMAAELERAMPAEVAARAVAAVPKVQVYRGVQERRRASRTGAAVRAGLEAEIAPMAQTAPAAPMNRRQRRAAAKAGRRAK